jgi:hypothetical protein
MTAGPKKGAENCARKERLQTITGIIVYKFSVIVD